MGLYKQPNDYTCGPFALKHALAVLGRLVSEHDISDVVRPHWWSGTDEVRLAEAARKHGCELPLVRRRDPRLARQKLRSYLDKGIPVLMCVDNWGHWITTVHHDKNRFIVIDSMDDPVLQVLTWPQLRTRWQYMDDEYEPEDEDFPTIFDLHPVTPTFRVPVKARFSVERAQFLRRPSNRDLGAHWDDYLGDLLEICRAPTGRTAVLSMAEFLRRHQQLLLAQLPYWHGDVTRTQVSRILRNFRFVAETYGLIIPESDRRRALVDVTILLSLWAASAHGVGDVYGSIEGDNPRKDRR